MQDQRNKEHKWSRICWIKEETNIISPRPYSIEAKERKERNKKNFAALK
jgi:hypothetical protein